MNLTNVPHEGIILREAEGRHVVLVRGSTDAGLLNDPAVSCLNPDAEPEQRVYRKEFVRRPIYLPTEFHLGQDHLRTKRHHIVVGANGYSSVTDAHAAAWHIDPQAYRIGVERLLTTIHAQILKELGDVEVAFVHGSSTRGMAARGVDTAIVNTATNLKRPQLGISCPRFMLYVDDEDTFPVYVAATQQEYSEQFVDMLDILVTCNGRTQTLEMDIRATIYKRKFVVLYDLLGAISRVGGPRAYGPDDQIDDAVKALISGIHLVGGDMHLLSGSKDRWKEDLLEISQAIIRRCRTHLPPEVGLRVNVP